MNPSFESFPRQAPSQRMARPAISRGKTACRRALGEDQSVLSRKGGSARHCPGKSQLDFHPQGWSKHGGLTMPGAKGGRAGNSRPAPPPLALGSSCVPREGRTFVRLPRQSADYCTDESNQTTQLENPAGNQKPTQAGRLQDGRVRASTSEERLGSNSDRIERNDSTALDRLIHLSRTAADFAPASATPIIP